jgi:hypothetical protein
VSAVSLWRHKQLCDPRGDNERFGCSGNAAPPHVHSRGCVDLLRPGGEGGHDGIDLIGSVVAGSKLKMNLIYTERHTREKRTRAGHFDRQSACSAYWWTGPAG